MSIPQINETKLRAKAELVAAKADSAVEQDTAATKIQSVYRGKHERRMVENNRMFLLSRRQSIAERDMISAMGMQNSLQKLTDVKAMTAAT